MLGGIKEKTAEKLQRLGIATIEDLLLHFPFRHEDFSRVTPIGFVKPGAKTTIRARVYRVRAGLTRFRRMRLTEAELSDGTGKLRAVWFNQPWVTKALEGTTEIFVAGTVERDGAGLVMKSPLYERVSSDPRHAGRLVPIYHETAGLTSRWLREKIQAILPLTERLEEFLP
ncbi:MAG TPA: DNA helicase RecG, partial [Candidatus Eisenbacteria bacterium]|nr:DNA helicase RecG [Candidatus Eisenbacteria bacterium]